MSFWIVLFAYFLSMLITAMLLSRSCPIVDLNNVLMRRRALKAFSAEHEVAGIVARMEVTLYRTGKMSWRPFWIDARSLPSRLRFLAGMGPCSRSFQRLTSHLIAFYYTHHKNLWLGKQLNTISPNAHKTSWSLAQTLMITAIPWKAQSSVKIRWVANQNK